MPTLLEYRRRIRSVKSTQQLTRAMKFVAAAKLRRAQEGVFAARPYAREIVRVMHSAAGRIETPVHPLLERRAEERVLAMVLTGDRTLCGAFNSNVVKRAVEFRRQHAGKKLSWIVVGKKGRDQLRKRGFPLLAEYVGISDRIDFRKAKEIAARVAEIYVRRETDAVYVVYNEFKNVLVQKLRVEKLLPIDPEGFTPETKGEQPHRTDAERAGQVDYIYEQPPEQVFAGLLTRYLEAEVLRVLLESVAAEQAARMTAMEAATTNAGELIETLTLDMNKIRQAAITKELIEIVSGAASIA